MLRIDSNFPLPVLGSSILALWLLFYLGRHLMALAARLRKPLNVPVLNLQGLRFAAASRAYYKDLESIITKGYRKYKESIYLIYTPAGYQAILPMKYVDEVIYDNEEKLQVRESTESLYKSGYEQSWLDPDWEVGCTTLRQGMNPRLEEVLPAMCEELRWIVPQVLGPAEDWTPVEIYKEYTRIAHAVIGRFFYGPGLCRDENFLKVTFEGEVDFYEVAYAIAKWPIFLRPLATRLLPRARALRANYEAMARLLTPVLEERLRRWPIGQKKSTDRPNDFMQWMLDASQSQPCPLARQCQILLDITTDAAFATNLQLTQISFDMATHPEYIQTLRDEFGEVLARPQEMTRSILGRMAKLDSVVKETHRTSPQAFVSLERDVTREIVLSDGVVLPQGLRIGFPTPQLGLDAELWAEPERYDGLRFFKLRQQSPRSQHDYQYMNSRDDFMLFGKGVHICPARILMSNVLKLTMMHVLDLYDMKLADPGRGRPKNTTMGNVLYPDREARIMLRRRQ